MIEILKTVSLDSSEMLKSQDASKTIPPPDIPAVEERIVGMSISNEPGVHGREKEIERLSIYQKEVLDGTTERKLVLISGNAGSGKSTLADTLVTRTSVTITKCNQPIYAKGKFDMTKTGKPYSAILDASSQICQHILKTQLNESKEVDGVCLQIIQSLDSELDILLAFIPDLHHLLENFLPKKCVEKWARARASRGTRNSVELKNQFSYAFLRFLRVVCRNVSPLVLILDDLQWADASSLDLMQVILTDHQNSKLLVVGVYRSNEVGQGHVFRRCLDRFESCSDHQDFSFSRLEVGGLEIEAIHGIIREFLLSRREGQLDSMKTLSFAELCREKTGGNAFYLMQLLVFFKDKGLVHFDNIAGDGWVWDEVQIVKRSKEIHSAEDILLKRIAQFDSKIARLIALSAPLGSPFDLHTLGILWNKKSLQIQNQPVQSLSMEDDLTLVLNFLEKEKIMKAVASPSGSTRYTWSHNQVQQAATSIIPKPDHNTFVKRVGEALMCYLSEDELDATVYLVASLLNMPEDWSNGEECFELAKLNLKAARNAMSCCAYDAAANYAKKAIGLLPDDAWEQHYIFSLELYTIGAKAEDFVRNDSAVATYCNLAFLQSQSSILESLDIRNVWIDNLLKQNRVVEARNFLLETLETLGCAFPEKLLKAGFEILRGIASMKSTLRVMEADNKLVRMEDPFKIESMRLLTKLFSTMWILQDPRMMLVNFRLISWTIKYGYCEESPGACAISGLLVAGFKNNPRVAARYGERSLTLLEMVNSPHVASLTFFPVYSFVFSWTKGVETLLKPLQRCYDLGLQAGDLKSASWGIYFMILFKYMIGEPLKELELETRLYSSQMRVWHTDEMFKLLRVLRQAFLNLMGEDNVEDPISIIGGALNAEDQRKDQHDEFQVSFERMVKGMLYTYYGNHVRHAKMVVKNGADYPFKMHVGSPNLMFDSYLKGISCFAAATETEEKVHLKNGNFYLAKMKAWANAGNPNVKHYYTFLQAEAAICNGKRGEAVKLYKETIAIAGKGGRHHDVAMANERMGHLLLKHANRQDAIGCYEDAIQHWRSWGALGKANSLSDYISTLYRTF